MAPNDAAVCDQAGGRDNALAKVFPLLGLIMGGQDLSTLYTTMAEQGGWSLLIRVRDYDGQADDDRVRVAWYISPGTPSFTPPQWQGADQWQVSPGSVGVGSDGGPDIDSPVVQDERAYVSGGVLVAGFPSAELVMSGGGQNQSWMAITITQGGVMGRLVPPEDEGGTGFWRLSDATLGGRIGMDDMFRALGSFRNDQGNPICTSDGTYMTGKDTLCSLPDILTTYGLPNHPCDAISVGISFAAVQAVIGQIQPLQTLTPGCDPDHDPAFDHCP